ncbi:MAG: hypothetical protein AAB864_00655, partial [Patescibacteria group bacterium]
MPLIADNYAALTIFDRIGFAVIGGFANEAPLERACCRDSKKPNPPIHSAIPTIKTRSPYRGFFVRAVMDTLANGLES